MDSSAAGRPPGMPPAEGWGRQVPVASPTVVARAQSVRPSKDSKELRDKRRDERKDSSHERSAADHDHTDDGDDHRPPHLTLQAIDPETGHVYWQAPLPSEPLNEPAGYAPPKPKPARPPQAEDEASTGHENPNSTGLLGKRAYEHHDDDPDTGPRVVRTA